MTAQRPGLPGIRVDVRQQPSLGSSRLRPSGGAASTHFTHPRGGAAEPTGVHPVLVALIASIGLFIAMEYVDGEDPITAVFAQV